MADSIVQQPVGTFLDMLASSAPTPGGGSVAALSGAMAAGLVSMVCALSKGKKQFADDAEEIERIHAQAEALRGDLQTLAQQDVAIFSRLSAAYKLPRTTEADAASRQAAIQTVTRQAAEVPLRVARTVADLLPLCTALAPRCSRMIVSDIGVAAVLVHATLQSAILNVEINLAGLEDQRYVREVRAQIEDMLIGVSEEVEGIVQIVRSRING
jgi:formiminotetrahydrofolate cyclodeaminase